MPQHHKLLERGSNIWSDDSIRLILTPNNNAKKIYFYPQEIGYFKTTYPYFSERQYLYSFLIVYTLSGKGYLEYNDDIFQVKKNDCFFINCNEHHLYRTDKSEDWEFLWIHFNANNAFEYYNEFTKNGFKIIHCQDRYFWEETLWQIMAIQQARDITTDAITSNLINSMLTQLIIRNITDNDDFFTIPKYIQKIAREIDKNFNSELSLSYFEKKYYRSKFHISKEFKKYIGMTINEYIILSRISYAKGLLKNTDLTVQEITFEVGMNNVSHFINLFKARENLTPLAYRKNWKK